MLRSRDQNYPPAALLPLTFGVPLPIGQCVADHPACQLLLGDYQCPAQTRPLAHWRDGSVCWLLVDALSPAALLDAPVVAAQVQVGGVARPVSGGLQITSEAGVLTVANLYLRMKIAPGATTPQIDLARRTVTGECLPILGTTATPAEQPSGWAVQVTLGNGRVLRAITSAPPLLEESGPWRAVIRYALDHCDEQGHPWLRSTTRLHIGATLPVVKVQHRLEVLGPADLSPAELALLAGGTTGEAATLLKVRSVALLLPCSATRLVAEEQSFAVDNGTSWALTQEQDDVYRLRHGERAQTITGQASGRCLLKGAHGQLAVGIHDFWQRYPKALHFADDTLLLHWLPPLSGAKLSGDDDAWRRLDFWRVDDLYLLKQGMALTDEATLAVAIDDEDPLRWLAVSAANPPVRPTVAWLNTTGVLRPLSAKDQTVAPHYEHMVDGAYQAWLRDQARARLYGFLNFGDTFKPASGADHEMNMWENNEYDAPFCQLIEFLRGGAPGWFHLAAQATRHLVDVDTCNHASAPTAQGGQYTHMQGHLGGYLPPYLLGSKMSGSAMLPSHTWVEGPALYYLLTGDETVRETIERTAAWLVQGGLNHYDFANVRELGWHLIHLCALAGLTADPRYENAAAILVERALERQAQGPTGRGGWIRLLGEAHCGCRPLRCRGEAGFMVGVLLSGLHRYYALTGDARVRTAIIGGARWLIDTLYNPQSGHFRYSSCPNRGRGESPLYTYMVLEGLADTLHLSADQRLAEVVAHGLALIGLPSDPQLMQSGPDRRGRVGKAFCSEARFAPFLLAAVQSFKLPAD
jgi:hypothetical protein